MIFFFFLKKVFQLSIFKKGSWYCFLYKTFYLTYLYCRLKLKVPLCQQFTCWHNVPTYIVEYKIRNFIPDSHFLAPNQVYLTYSNFLIPLGRHRGHSRVQGHQGVSEIERRKEERERERFSQKIINELIKQILIIINSKIIINHHHNLNKTVSFIYLQNKLITLGEDVPIVLLQLFNLLFALKLRQCLIFMHDLFSIAFIYCPIILSYLPKLILCYKKYRGKYFRGCNFVDKRS